MRSSGANIIRKRRQAQSGLRRLRGQRLRCMTRHAALNVTAFQTSPAGTAMRRRHALLIRRWLDDDCRIFGSSRFAGTREIGRGCDTRPRGLSRAGLLCGPSGRTWSRAFPCARRMSIASTNRVDVPVVPAVTSSSSAGAAARECTPDGGMTCRRAKVTDSAMRNRPESLLPRRGWHALRSRRRVDGPIWRARRRLS